MTIEIKIASCDDLSVANEVMNFNHVKLPKDYVLAGGNWLAAASSAYDSLLLVLRFVYAAIFKKLPSHKLWLLIGSSTWQPDTRIIRHRKLWGALKARGIEISHSSNSQEAIIEKDGKLKFFGATQFSELSISSIVRALLDEHCAYIVAMPDALKIQDILEIAWSGDLSDDFNLIDYLSKGDGLIFKKVGEFDDPERGLVVIGRAELIKMLMN